MKDLQISTPSLSKIRSVTGAEGSETVSEYVVGGMAPAGDSSLTLVGNEPNNGCGAFLGGNISKRVF